MNYSTTIFKLLLIIIPALYLGSCSEDSSCNVEESTNPSDMPYNVIIDPSDFKAEDIVGNTYFPLNTGTTMVYAGEDEDGSRVDIEEYFTGDTKVVMGVTCVIVEFKEWIDGELVEATYDWYAQDLKNNVWYFGEESNDYENGKLISTAGSWEAGVDGALPGILMFAEPEIGVWYRQEYYAGEAEDVGQILGLNANVSTPAGSFSDCLITADWSPLEPGIVEHKYYAPGIGTVRIEKVEGKTGFEELVAIQSK